MARSSYIYILDDEGLGQLIPFTVKHEMESYLNANYPIPENNAYESLTVLCVVKRYLDGRPSNPVVGEIVRCDDGMGWTVRFRKEVTELRQDEDPTTEPTSWP